MGQNTRIYDKFTDYATTDCICENCRYKTKTGCLLEVCCCAEEKAEALRREVESENRLKSEGGVFFGEGYIMHRLGGVSDLYDGVAFDDCKLTATALRGLPTKPALGEKPSVMDEINASQKNARGSEKRAASKGRDVQKSKKNKGEADL